MRRRHPMQPQPQPAPDFSFMPFLEGPEPDLEWRVITIRIDPAPDPNELKRLEALLNDGWLIEDKIKCPEIIILTLSREKESASDDTQPK